MAGSYTKRANSYRLRFTYKGKTYSKTIKLSKGQKIERELDKFVEEIKNGNNISSNINFITFAQKWLDDYAKPNLRERTVQGYKDYLNLRLVPYFGNMNLSDIQLYDIQKFVNSLSSTLSSETIRKYKNCLSCIFNYAVKWNFLKFNPCNGVIVPKGLDTSVKPVFLTKDEVKQLLICLNKEELKYQIIVRLALQCGLRRSEILALTWKAIDFNNCTSLPLFTYVGHALFFINSIFPLNKSKISISKVAYMSSSVLAESVELINFKDTSFSKPAVNNLSNIFTAILLLFIASGPEPMPSLKASKYFPSSNFICKLLSPETGEPDFVDFAVPICTL